MTHASRREIVPVDFWDIPIQMSERWHAASCCENSDESLGESSRTISRGSIPTGLDSGATRYSNSILYVTPMEQVEHWSTGRKDGYRSWAQCNGTPIQLDGTTKRLLARVV